MPRPMPLVAPVTNATRDALVTCDMRAAATRAALSIRRGAVPPGERTAFPERAQRSIQIEQGSTWVSHANARSKKVRVGK